MTDASTRPDTGGETPPCPPEGCAVSDVIAVVLALLVDRGHRIGPGAADQAPARSAAVGLLLALDVRPVLDEVLWRGPPYYGLGSGPFHLDGELR